MSETDPTAPIRYELDGDVAVVTLDDGKVNALSHSSLDSLDAALDRAEKEARALLLVGREGRFSAGFDLSVMTAGADEARALVTHGAEFLMRLYLFRLPTVAACSGHALAAGALVLLASDFRIGAEGDFKIGLNEVAIGMGLPIFAVELARDRLSKRHLVQATVQARVYDPVEAVDAGYLDRTVGAGDLMAAATAEAARLGSLRAGAYRRTKELTRQAVANHILETLADDMAGVSGPPPEH